MSFDIHEIRHSLATLETTNAGGIPVQILGGAKIQSNHPLYEHDLETEYLAYASLRDGSTYGNPAFWFGLPHELMPNLVEVTPIDDSSAIEDESLTEATFRKIIVIGSEIMIDNTGLSRYHVHTPNLRDGHDNLILLPEGYQ